MSGPEVWLEDGEQAILEEWVHGWLTFGDVVIIALIVGCLIGWVTQLWLA